MTADFESNLLEQLNPKLSPDEVKRLALEAIQATDTEKVAGAIRGYRKSGKPVSTKTPINQITKGQLIGTGAAGAAGGVGLGILGSEVMSEKKKLAGALKGALKGSAKGAGVGLTTGLVGGSLIGASRALSPELVELAKKFGMTQGQLAKNSAILNAMELSALTTPIGAVAGGIRGGIKGHRDAKKLKSLADKMGIGVTAGAPVGALAAASGSKKKTAAVGADAAAGALLGSLVPVPGAGPLGAAIGANLGKGGETRKRRSDRLSPEIRAAIGSILGSGVLGLAAGGAGALTGAALSNKIGLPPAVAAQLGAYGAGVPGAIAGSAVGGYKGAEGAYKQKKASVTLSGLRYASTASYRDSMEKRAFVSGAAKAVKGFFNPSLGQRMSKGVSQIRDAYFGGAPVKGAVQGGLAGAFLGGASKLNRLRQGRNYAMMSDADFAKAMQGLRKQSRGTGMTADAAKSALKSNTELRNRFLNMGGGTVPRLFDEGGKFNTEVASRYAKEFGGDVLKNMAGFGAGGAALGTGKQLLTRAMTRRRMADLGSSALPLAAVGGGGLLLGSALAN